MKLLYTALLVAAGALLFNSEYIASIGFFISGICLAVAASVRDKYEIDMVIKDRQLAVEREYRYVCVDNYIKQRGTV
jgi:hypothetical protein